jgi:ketosteroid isomerase-like protein
MKRAITQLVALAGILGLALLGPALINVSARQAAAELYTCPMHANVVETHAGACPVCLMALRPRAVTPAEAEVIAFFKAYDTAFAAKDLGTLAAMYAPETTVFEGGGVNAGWKDYRDNHLGPELKSYETVEFAHTNVVPHLLGTDAAYVTAEYTIKTKAAGRISEGGGLATYTLAKTGGAWKIRHTHTSAKRRAPGVPVP